MELLSYSLTWLFFRHLPRVSIIVQRESWAWPDIGGYKCQKHLSASTRLALLHYKILLLYIYQLLSNALYIFDSPAIPSSTALKPTCGFFRYWLITHHFSIYTTTSAGNWLRQPKWVVRCKTTFDPNPINYDLASKRRSQENHPNPKLSPPQEYMGKFSPIASVVSFLANWMWQGLPSVFDRIQLSRQRKQTASYLDPRLVASSCLCIFMR